MARARGMCATHYGRWRKGTDLDAPILAMRPRTAERLWAGVDRTGGEDACWPWLGALMDDGYGLAFPPYRSAPPSAHWVAWYFTTGSRPPAGMHLDHICHDPDACAGGITCPHRRCCNPSHLKPVTPLENTRRSNAPAVAYRARIECDQGHPLSGANLAIRTDGSRKCRKCHALYMREWNRNRHSKVAS